MILLLFSSPTNVSKACGFEEMGGALEAPDFWYNSGLKSMH